MTGMSMGMVMSCSQRLEREFSHEQRLGLHQLFLLEQKLRHPEYSGAVRGLEGMKAAHEILQERGASGVLIGGLAEAVWNRRRKQEDLSTHKDVDVAVLDDDFELSEVFEGGVDWWTPQYGTITIQYETSKAEGVQKTWYENGKGVVLSFGITRENYLEPGLYIPDCEWLVDMRKFEAKANVDTNRVDVKFDDPVFNKFGDRVRKRLGKSIPKFIRDAFEGYILSERYEQGGVKADSLSLKEFDSPTVVGINMYIRGR